MKSKSSSRGKAEPSPLPSPPWPAAGGFKCSPKSGLQFPTPGAATELHTPHSSNHDSRPFWAVGPFRPSLVRGDSPRNAPLKNHLDATVCAQFQLVADAQPGGANVRARFQHAADAQPGGANVRARFQHAADAQPGGANVRARLTQFESRFTNHDSRPFWTVGPFRPSLVRGDSPRNAPLKNHLGATVCANPAWSRRECADAIVSSRFQLAADAPRARRQRACALPSNRAFYRPPPPPQFLLTVHYPLSTIHCQHEFPTGRLPPLTWAAPAEIRHIDNHSEICH